MMSHEERVKQRLRRQGRERLFVLSIVIFIISSIAISCINVCMAINLHEESKDLLNKMKAEREEIENLKSAGEVEETAVPPAKESVSRGGLDKRVPKIDTSQKTFMDYRCLSSGKQLELQNLAYTDRQGFRKIGEAYLVALGSYYGEVGDNFEITLDSGVSFLVIKGDEKSDQHTDPQHMHRNGNVVEFIVDTNKIGSEALLKGSVSCLGFEGSVQSIRLLFTQNAEPR